LENFRSKGLGGKLRTSTWMPSLGGKKTGFYSPSLIQLPLTFDEAAPARGKNFLTCQAACAAGGEEDNLLEGIVFSFKKYFDLIYNTSFERLIRQEKFNF